MYRARRGMAAVAIAGVAAMALVTLSSTLCLAKQPTNQRKSIQDFEWSGKIPANGFLEIKGLNGRIEAGPSADGVAHVTAIKRFRNGDADAVRIEVEEDAQGITICVIYPGGRDCDKQTGGLNWSNDVNVDFTVEVPASARLLASTVNGSIVAEIGVGRWPKSLKFSTVNGGITLALPRAPDADLKASTVNGSITTDFALQVQGRVGRRSLKGTLGKGGPALHLTTVNGAIRLRDNDS